MEQRSFEWPWMSTNDNEKESLKRADKLNSTSRTRKEFPSLTVARRELSQKEIRSLISKAKGIAQQFRQKEADLIDVLEELDCTKAFRDSGFNSLYCFCVEVLKLSESQAYHYIAVARKCAEVPELKYALKEKRISASKARRLCSVLNISNSEEWIDIAEQCNHRELERAVRAKDPQSHKPDRMSYISENYLFLEATLHESTREKLALALDILRSKEGGVVRYDKLLSELADLYLSKHDPVQKAKRSQARKGAKTQSQLCSAKSKTRAKKNAKAKFASAMSGLVGAEFVEKEPANAERVEVAKATTSRSKTSERKAFSAQLRHAVHLRDQGRCQFKQGDAICGSRAFLEFHHIQPVAYGGDDSLENLISLCSAHHKHLHEKT